MLLKSLKKIKEYGFRLIVLGGIQDDPAHSIADESIFADYRDIKSCVYECKDKEIENVVPGSNDIAFDCALAIADELGIKTFDSSHVIEQLHNKTQFRKLLTNCQIPQPKIYSKKDVEAQGFNSWPIMVKPELAFSGNGITIIDNKDQLHSAVNRAKKISRNGGISIEQFVSGDLYSVSTFIAQEDIAYSFFANEFCNLNQFAVDYSYTPSNLSHSIQSAILLDIEKILKKLQLKDGLLHFQFIYDPLTSTYYFIECMRRMIGDFYGKKNINSV